MAVVFLVGRAGTGKSRRCFEEIVELLRADPLGPPIFWIVPKQETFSAERDLACSSGLPGASRARVVSFERFGDQVIEECGGNAIPRIDSPGRRMLIGYLLRKLGPELSHFKSSGYQPGLAARLDDAFSEIERCGKTVEDLRHAVDALSSNESEPADDPALARKVRDFKTLFEAYSAHLGQERLDPHRRLLRVLENLAHCKSLRGSIAYVDGFTEYTEPERQILAGLARFGTALTVTHLLDPGSPILTNPHHQPDQFELFFRTETTYRSLWFTLVKAGLPPPRIERLATPSRFQNETLALLEANAFSGKRSASKTSAAAIRFVEAPSRRDEVDIAARHIKSHVAGGGRFRDIAVLARDLDDYQELIRESFGEHDIAYFVDRQRSAGYHPLVAMLRSLIEIARFGLANNSLLSLAKTGLAGLGRDEVDQLENYVLLHRIRGAAWSSEADWCYQRRIASNRNDEPDVGDPAPPAPDCASADALRRRLIGPLLPFLRSVNAARFQPLRGFALALVEVVERFGVRASLSSWIQERRAASQTERAAEHEQVWKAFAELIDQLIDVLGEQSVEFDDLAQTVTTGLDGFEVSLAPPTIDQVIVGTIQRTRAARPRVAIILGLNDGQFPRSAQEDCILSDRERATLGRRGIDLDGDSKRSLLDEQLSAYIAFTRASDSLLITRSIADEQARPQMPSPYWQELTSLFPTAAIDRSAQASAADANLDRIATPRQLVSGVMNWVRHGDHSKTDSPHRALYERLASRAAPAHARLDDLRASAWPALKYRNHAFLSASIAAAMYAPPFTSSVSRIETFARCAFQHFSRYGLGLFEREAQDVTSLDLGNVCHGILEKLVGEMLRRAVDWTGAEELLADERLLKSLAAQVGQELRGQVLMGTARNDYILGHVERVIGQVIAAQSAAGARGMLSPWKVELPFGPDTPLGPLVIRTPGGNELRLRGKIDRVDRLKDQAEFAVIDYKYRGSSLALDHVRHGLALQLLTYLLVLERNGQDLAGRKLTPVAAFYVQLLRDLEKVDHPADATAPDDPAFDLRIKPRGVINAAHRRLFDAEHETNASQVVQLHIKKDGTIGHKGRSDGCEQVEFEGLLRLVEQKLGEIADQIIGGNIEVRPYRIGQVSPCPYCEYASVCRFDPSINRYRYLETLGREGVLAEVCRDDVANNEVANGG